MSFVIALWAAVLPSPTPAPAPVNAQGGLAYWPTNGWRVSTPEAQGMRSAELERLLAYLNVPIFYIDSMIVIRNGYIVAEAYYDAANMYHMHYLNSISKSIVSALIGIAIDQGHIPSVDQRVLSLFPNRTVQNVNLWKTSVTVRHLLMMSAGFECDALGAIGDNGVYATRDNWVQASLDLPMTYQPGTRFSYCNPATTLLSGLINETTGMSALDYARVNLFAPMGIYDVAWIADSRGVNFGADGLQLNLRDLAKIGLLYLQNGQWDGRQLIPAAWVTESVGPQMHNVLGTRGVHYGYQWWYYEPYNMYCALGNAGEQLCICPDRNLIFASTSSANIPLRFPYTAFPSIFRLDQLTIDSQ